MGFRAVGPCPRAGQTVECGVAGQTVRMELTQPPAASSIDTPGTQPRYATWLVLTGWEVDENGRRLLERTLTTRRDSIAIVQLDGPP